MTVLVNMTFGIILININK